MFDKRTIFHIDVNSAFLSWEAVYRLSNEGALVDLREIPSAIAGDVAMRRGIILAKSIPAKSYGIHTGESILEARQKCPNLYLAPPNYQLYQRSSEAFLAILREYTPQIEQYSIDEVYLDMTETKDLFGGARAAACEIRDRISRELGFTVNVGISSNKLLAKMASDFEKPNRVHTLYPEEIRKKMWHLPVADLFFVGRATTGKLADMGILTIGELARTDPGFLRTRLKKHGEVVWAFANGLDFSRVESVPEPNKGYGNSTTISFDVKDACTAKRVLLSLAETVCARLRQDGVKAGLVSVGIKDFRLCHASHQKVLGYSTNITKEVYQEACGLFGQLWDGTPIRHLGIHTGRLQKAGLPRQLSLFAEDDYEKLEEWDEAIDSIRGRYGMDAVKRAVFLKGEAIDHMSGGISREKRTVDYSQLKIE